MAETKSDLLQGTLDMLILKTLSLGAMHGWGISQRIQRISRLSTKRTRDLTKIVTESQTACTSGSM